MDLNVDLGEGVGESARRDDALLLDVVTSANIACGYHAGDAEVMRRTCDEAVARGVTVGAHVSYRDLEGFGRRDVDVPFEQLVEELLEQIGALSTIGDA
ncbi:MAG: LamB/YcsF family protein, partial [Actinobacteria bacterium]|nr:LamB/YcsF family protein [Actinomycetota bacterium]